MNSPDIFGWMSVNDASSVAVSAVMKAFLRVFSKMLLAELGFRLKSVFSLSQGSPYISSRWNSATFKCSTNINSTAAQLFPGERMVWSVYESSIWKELHTRLNLSYLRRNNLTLWGENDITHTTPCVCSSLVSSCYQQQTMPHSLLCSDGCLTSSNGNLKCTLEENKTVQIRDIKRGIVQREYCVLDPSIHIIKETVMILLCLLHPC